MTEASIGSSLRSPMMTIFACGFILKSESQMCFVVFAASARRGLERFKPPPLDGQWSTMICISSLSNKPETQS